MTEQTLTYEEQIRRAQALIEENTKRLADVEALKLQSLRARAAQVAADKAREQMEAQLKHEAQVAAIRKRREEEQKEVERQKREEAQRQAELQMEISRAEESVREQNRKQAELDRLNAHAQQLANQAALEAQEAQRLLDLVDAGISKQFTPSADPEEAKPFHPLGRFLQTSEDVVPEPVEGEISSVQQSRTQMISDNYANQLEYGNQPVLAQPPVAEPAAPTVRTRTHPSSQQVFDLQRVWEKTTGYQCNFDALLELLAWHSDTEVYAKLKELAPTWKQRPCSAASQVAQVQDALQNPPPTAAEVFAAAQAQAALEEEQLLTYAKKLRLDPSLPVPTGYEVPDVSNA